MAKAKVIRHGDKCAFVRSLPRSLPASIIVERAKKKGMIISTAYVHNIRSASNKESRVLLKKTKPKVKGSTAQKEKIFKELVISLGPSRARKLLDQVEDALRHQ